MSICWDHATQNVTQGIEHPSFWTSKTYFSLVHLKELQALNKWDRSKRNNCKVEKSTPSYSHIQIFLFSNFHEKEKNNSTKKQQYLREIEMRCYKMKPNKKTEKANTIGHFWLVDNVCPSFQLTVIYHEAILDIIIQSVMYHSTLPFWFLILFFFFHISFCFLEITLVFKNVFFFILFFTFCFLEFNFVLLSKM